MEESLSENVVQTEVDLFLTLFHPSDHLVPVLPSDDPDDDELDWVYRPVSSSLLSNNPAPDSSSAKADGRSLSGIYPLANFLTFSVRPSLIPCAEDLTAPSPFPSPILNPEPSEDVVDDEDEMSVGRRMSEVRRKRMDATERTREKTS